MKQKILKVLVIDDEVDALEVLSGILENSGFVYEIIKVQDALKVECTIQKEHPDALLMDIEMPRIDGLQLLENIRENDQDLPVILITAYEKYIPEAIKLHVYSYLLKPVDRKELNVLLSKLAERKKGMIGNIIRDKIRLPVKNGYIYLEPDRIYMLEADGNYTHIYTTDNREYLSSYNMGRIAQRIAGANLLRINRGQFLNGKYLVQVNKKELSCIARFNGNDNSYPVSRAFLTQFNREAH